MMATPTSRELTPRETEVAALVCQEMRDREIAERLCISILTVGDHLKALRAKLGVRSRVGIALAHARVTATPEAA